MIDHVCGEAGVPQVVMLRMNELDGDPTGRWGRAFSLVLKLSTDKCADEQRYLGSRRGKRNSQQVFPGCQRSGHRINCLSVCVLGRAGAYRNGDPHGVNALGRLDEAAAIDLDPPGLRLRQHDDFTSRRMIELTQALRSIKSTLH